MAEGVNVRFSGSLQKFVEERSDGKGLYGSASEYIRDLVRRDYEKEEQRRWDALYGELKVAMAAPESEFVDFDGPSILREARARSAGTS